ncbi:MAG: SRPBCC domain-containing protein [Xanthomonadaceae bacterium]|jgi:uncharacterized protein YndB with AHSA1/START domain|nr:SRPBCC domain-containing protein [Xanthomonadaceae bacterium]
MSETPSLTTTVGITLDAMSAFHRFTKQTGSWWPKSHTWSRDVLQDIRIDPRIGGLCTELGPHGFRCDFGRVIDVEPGRRLIFTWQVAFDRRPQPDPSKASEVEINFLPIEQDHTSIVAGHHTSVTLTHRYFDRHGPDGARYRQLMASRAGWPTLLRAFVHVTSS